jgi:hypothetical protein
MGRGRIYGGAWGWGMSEGGGDCRAKWEAKQHAERARSIMQRSTHAERSTHVQREQSSADSELEVRRLRLRHALRFFARRPLRAWL